MIINGDCLEELKKIDSSSIDSIVTDPPYGISFMGKKWDYDVPSVEVWKECLRVLKPGGHALVACGTRTQHRMAVNLEDAGFEIRDIVAWIYGSGFPKSLNIGKAVDKKLGNEREDLGENPNNRTGKYENELTLKPFKGEHITKGSSKYEGWGTALKPAMELWTLARKPLEEKTVAENCLKWGTGGINIDECRVGTEDDTSRKVTTQGHFSSEEIKQRTNGGNHQGRFPANLIHDGSDEVVEKFPDTKKGSKSGYNFDKGNDDNPSHITGNIKSGIHFGDSGSASRFFYCAKASKFERNAGLEGFEKKEMTDYGSIKKSEGRTGINTPQANSHPTVKPIKLMEYLCRLITPKGGKVLDPYMGSGSTGIACKNEGFDFIGIEKEEEYVKIAEARINSIKQSKLKL